MTRFLLALALAGCATARPPPEPGPEPQTWHTMVEAEIDAVTRFAVRLPGTCSQLQLERLGGAGFVFYTLPRTIETSWRVVACERVVDSTLGCSDSTGAGAFHCGTHEEWYPERQDDTGLEQLFFATALREATQLPGAGDCAEAIAVRSVGGYRRSGEVDLEKCGATKRLIIRCEGDPLRCAPR